MVKPRADDELADRLHSATLQLLRWVAREDAATGISAARLSALSALVVAGGRTIGGLAAAERVTPPSMTRLVAAMERDGLVTRTRDPDDGRVVRLEATAAGRLVLVAGRERRIAALRAVLTDASPKERKTLGRATALLERMTATAQAPRDPRPAGHGRPRAGGARVR